MQFLYIEEASFRVLALIPIPILILILILILIRFRHSILVPGRTCGVKKFYLFRSGILNTDATASTSHPGSIAA